MKLGIGIDTGGTYTDGVIYNFDTQEVLAKCKSLTTKENLEIGIGNVLDLLPMEYLRKASVIALSTTLATNACVENKGGRAKLILIGSSKKTLQWIDSQNKYGLNHADILCVENQGSQDGTIVNDPNWEAIFETEKEWFSEAQSFAVAELYSQRNGARGEKLAKEKVTSKYNVPFVMSNELTVDLNMMERGATALLNARLLPVIEDFLHAVNNAFNQRELSLEKLVVRSDGSLMAEKWTKAHPVTTILSGPAASTIGASVLTKIQNSLIVDMGGTTTDISIVKNTTPIMTEGIKIGPYRTKIKGVLVDTIGLGGDSRITVEDNLPVLNARKVQPLCILASQYPSVLNDLKTLNEQYLGTTPGKHEFLYLVKKPGKNSNYTQTEMEIIETLSNGPVMVGSSVWKSYYIPSDRLEDEGIVMRAGLTPTDIMHILGDCTLFSKEASIQGAEYMLKSIFMFEENLNGFNDFCYYIYDLISKKLYENILRVLLEITHPKLFVNGIEPQLLALLRENFDKKDETIDEFLQVQFNSQMTLVGIGAPTYLFLPKVAKALNVDYIIPEHAEVANALGAIAADIWAKASVLVKPSNHPTEVAYFVYSKHEQQTFETLEEAIEYAKKAAEELAVQEARGQGALGELQITIKEDANIATTAKGDSIFLSTTIIAKAMGRV